LNRWFGIVTLQTIDVLDASEYFLEQPFTPEAGMMPHPERASEPALGSDDGKWLFESISVALKNKTVAAAA
jgi:hypothetical protein